VLDEAVEVEVVVVVAAVAAVAAATVATVDPAPGPVAVAVDPVARITGAGVPGVVSFCARFVALPKPRSLPIIPPPGVPGVASPFPLAPLPFPVPAPAPLPVFSSGMVEAGAVSDPAPAIDTDGRRVGAARSSFCVAALVVAAVAVGSTSACAR
jgi:hypothetical protein